ncbi:MAG: hypothetical protein ACI8P0_006070, partial [Planctomycetaceae bacterium]
EPPESRNVFVQPWSSSQIRKTTTLAIMQNTFRHAHRKDTVDAELALIIEAWPTLSPETRKAVIGLVENSGYAPETH